MLASGKMKKVALPEGFTLVELLVACFLFLLLSTMLVGIIRNMVETWEYVEDQNLLHAEARKIIAYLREDLMAIYTHGTPYHDTRLVLDYDSHPCQRLRFIKRLLPETQYSVFQEAGSKPAEIKDGYDQYFYFSHPVKNLRAPGGLAEVVYLLLPGKTSLYLWRGVRAPVEGNGSFFLEQNLQSSDQIYGTCHEISRNVLHLGFKCWGYRTTSWDEREGPEKGGPSLLWDSTCQNDPRFFLYQKSASPVFPSKIQIELILASEYTPSGILTRAIEGTDQTILLKDQRRFYDPLPGEIAMVKIENEWISYSDYEEGRLTGVRRGILGSEAAAHPANSKVQGGRYFCVTIALPCYRSPWLK